MELICAEEFAFRGAIFDVDETLIETLELWNDINAALLRRYGIPVDAALLRRLNTLSLTHAIAYLTETLQLPMTPEALRQEIWDAALRVYRDEVVLKDGAFLYLTCLKERGVRMSVATSNARELIEPALRHCGVFDLFDAVLYTDDFQTDKRSPRLYQEAAARMGLAPRECVVFEDLYEGLVAASSAGFYTAAVLCDSPLYDRAAILQAADTAFERYVELMPRKG